MGHPRSVNLKGRICQQAQPSDVNGDVILPLICQQAQPSDVNGNVILPLICQQQTVWTIAKLPGWESEWEEWMPLSMAEAFVEGALANLEGDVGDEPRWRFLTGADALIKRAERRAQGAAITVQDGSMATLNTQEQGLTFEMAVHHSSGPRAFAWGQRTYSPLPLDLDDEWARALPQGWNGLRTAEYLAGLAGLAGPKQREGEALIRAETETGHRAGYRRSLLRTRRFARVVASAGAHPGGRRAGG